MMKFERPTDKYDAALILRNLKLILERIKLVNLGDWTINVDEWELELSKGDYSIHVVIDEWEINELLVDVGFFKKGTLEHEYNWNMQNEHPFYCYIAYLMMLASE